jgi:hypothetical protein
MDYGWNDEKPSQYYFLQATATNEQPRHVPTDYLWLERYLPYSPECEGRLHWFLRFK